MGAGKGGWPSFRGKAGPDFSEAPSCVLEDTGLNIVTKRHTEQCLAFGEGSMMLGQLFIIAFIILPFKKKVSSEHPNTGGE